MAHELLITPTAIGRRYVYGSNSTYKLLAGGSPNPTSA